MSSTLLVNGWRAAADRRQGMPLARLAGARPCRATLGLRGGRAGLGSEEGLGEE